MTGVNPGLMGLVPVALTASPATVNAVLRGI